MLHARVSIINSINFILFDVICIIKKQKTAFLENILENIF